MNPQISPCRFAALLAASMALSVVGCAETGSPAMPPAGGPAAGGAASGGATTGGTTGGSTGTTTGGSSGGSTTGSTTGGTTGGSTGGTTGGSSGGSTGGSSGGSTGGGTTTTTYAAIEVDTPALNVRAGPGTGFDIIGASHQGEVYVQFDTDGSWRRIWFDDGPAWVHGSYVKASTAAVWTVTAEMLNVRSGPGTQYSIAGHVHEGMLRAVIGTSGDWRKISFDGSEAWVHGAYLGDPAQAPPGSQLAPSRPQSTRGYIQLPASGPGFYSNTTADRRWALPRFVYGFERLARSHSIANPTWARIGVGDFSFENGGPISGHVSHQKGVDGDFRLQSTDGYEGPLTYTTSNYSRSRTQELVDRFYENMMINLILFNDPQVTGVQPYPNHDNHLHVRMVE